MPAPTVISADKLSRLVGTAGAPGLIDVRNDEDFDDDPRLVPGSFRRSHTSVAEWGLEFKDRAVVVSHDEHHQHGHNLPVTEPHSHVHLHERLRHKHPHYPDLHHRHSH